MADIIGDKPQYQRLRQKLTEQLRTLGITDAAVLQAIGKIPRHLFIAEEGTNTFLHWAYDNTALPIGAGQTISQPYTVAFQTQLLQLQRHDKVLEIGTGSGYQTAVLLEMGATVYTIERHRELYLKAQQRLPKLGYFPKLFCGDGYIGLPNSGRFDKIIVTAAAPQIPETLQQQLAIGGRMVIPVGNDTQKMVLIVRNDENNFTEEVCAGKTFIFVPMIKGKVL
ncbi:MAG: protein-L-isoaspartate(D-aspartate) O-methyltransferase [Bacteroidales bacterium]|jgi:protein-L-isoaspartate(D-aspartate) O-methyltransferase|nr:protein-L-isoaspartate(D-aspartate) O-methyltransferase [Bacteroidales bacterium]